MGFVLELKNRKAVGITYAKNNGAANSTWMSRNMIYSGAFILIFLVIHFLDFWIPEVKYKYIDVLPRDPNRYYEELVHKFVPVWRVALYIIGFIFLSLHLMHGFKSAFQSVGIPSIRKKVFQTCGKIYAIVIPLGFIIIALYHHFNQ